MMASDIIVLSGLDRLLPLRHAFLFGMVYGSVDSLRLIANRDALDKLLGFL